MAIVLAPKNELPHYAYAWGPSRHGPGNNHFIYLRDNDGAMIELCSELAQMPPEGVYQARKWPIDPTTINQWGGPPPLRFLLTGFPIVTPAAQPR